MSHVRINLTKNKIILFFFLLSVGVFVGCGSKQSTVTNEESKTVEDTEKSKSEDETVEEPDNALGEEIVAVDHSKCRLDSLEQADDGTGIATYDGVNHDFILDLPDNEEGAPLVLMLHGYGESASALRQKTAFEKDANAKGYVVVYITGAPSPEDPTSSTGWNSGIGVSSNKDVEFLCALANELCALYSLDTSRVFAVGFSNGAFMTHRLAVEADDIFAAVVSVAGMMPENIWTTRPADCNIGILQVTGEKDDVVPKNSDGSANYSKAPAIEEVMEYYVSSNGLALTDTVNLGKKSILEKYTSSDSKKQVWNIFIPDGRHSWPEESIVGFNTNEIILDFLETE